MGHRACSARDRHVQGLVLRAAAGPRRLELPIPPHCLTLSYMKSSALTIRLDRALERQLAALAKRSGRSRSDIARDALRRQLTILQFEDARRSVMPFAEARGYLTDEDIFDAVS
jgi:predicted transcriptional regulator